MSLSRRSLSMLPAIRRARTAPRKLTSTIRALEPWKYPKSLHQGKNEKNGIAEAIPFSLAPRCFLIGRHLPASPFFYATKQPGGNKTHRPPDTAARLRPTKQPVYFTTEQPGGDTWGIGLYGLCLLKDFTSFLFIVTSINTVSLCLAASSCGLALPAFQGKYDFTILSFIFEMNDEDKDDQL